MVHNNSHSENVIKMPLYYGFHCFRFQFIKATHQPKDLCLSWYTENISHICDLVPAIIQPFLQPQRVAVTRQSVASQRYLYCLGKLLHLYTTKCQNHGCNTKLLESDKTTSIYNVSTRVSYETL